MLGNDNTLRSGHMLLLLFVSSSIILGLGYMNEMYQRIQLQTDMAIAERQTHYAASERLDIQHKAAQLQMKVEDATQERKRLQDMYEFQSQQQNANFVKQKQDLLEDISLKEETIAKLQDQYESLKVHFDNLHSVMDEFQKNQSRLLEKFSTQSTQCMNVINMMSELCNKGKTKIQKILPYIKEKKTMMTAVTSQSPTVTNTPEIISVVSSTEGHFTKAQIPLIQATEEKPFIWLGGKQRHLILSPEVNELSSELKDTGRPENDRYNTLAPNLTARGPYIIHKAQEKMTSPAEGDLYEVINKNYLNENSTKTQRTIEKRLVDLHISNHNAFENVSYSEHMSENEGIALKNPSLHLTNSSNLTSSNLINVTQDDGERKRNLTLSDVRTPETTIRNKATKETPNVNFNALNSLLAVYKTEKIKRDGDTKEEKIKYNETYVTGNDKENYEKILQFL